MVYSRAPLVKLRLLRQMTLSRNIVHDPFYFFWTSVSTDACSVLLQNAERPRRDRRWTAMPES